MALPISRTHRFMAFGSFSMSPNVDSSARLSMVSSSDRKRANRETCFTRSVPWQLGHFGDRALAKTPTSALNRLEQVWNRYSKIGMTVVMGIQHLVLRAGSVTNDRNRVVPYPRKYDDNRAVSCGFQLPENGFRLHRYASFFHDFCFRS